MSSNSDFAITLRSSLKQLVQSHLVGSRPQKENDEAASASSNANSTSLVMDVEKVDSGIKVASESGEKDHEESSSELAAVDVWRILQAQATLELETQKLRDVITSDPLEAFYTKDDDECLNKSKMVIDIEEIDLKAPSFAEDHEIHPSDIVVMGAESVVEAGAVTATATTPATTDDAAGTATAPATTKHTFPTSAVAKNPFLLSKEVEEMAAAEKEARRLRKEAKEFQVKQLALLKKLKNLLVENIQVVDYSECQTLEGFVTREATVELPKDFKLDLPSELLSDDDESQEEEKHNDDHSDEDLDEEVQKETEQVVQEETEELQQEETGTVAMDEEEPAPAADNEGVTEEAGSNTEVPPPSPQQEDMEVDENSAHENLVCVKEEFLEEEQETTPMRYESERNDEAMIPAEEQRQQSATDRTEEEVTHDEAQADVPAEEQQDQRIAENEEKEHSSDRNPEAATEGDLAAASTVEEIVAPREEETAAPEEEQHHGNEEAPSSEAVAPDEEEVTAEAQTVAEAVAQAERSSKKQKSAATDTEAVAPVRRSARKHIPRIEGLEGGSGGSTQQKKKVVTPAAARKRAATAEAGSSRNKKDPSSSLEKVDPFASVTKYKARPPSPPPAPGNPRLKFSFRRQPLPPIARILKKKKNMIIKPGIMKTKKNKNTNTKKAGATTKVVPKKKAQVVKFKATTGTERSRKKETTSMAEKKKVIPNSTRVSYHISYSPNGWGPCKTLLYMEVEAPGNQPSLHGVAQRKKPSPTMLMIQNDGQVPEVRKSKKNEDDDRDYESQESKNEYALQDKLDIVIDDENFMNLLADWNVQKAVQYDFITFENILLILMTFEYYEHEWPLVDYLLDTVLEDNEEEEEEEELERINAAEGAKPISPDDATSANPNEPADTSTDANVIDLIKSRKETIKSPNSNELDPGYEYVDGCLQQ